MRTNPVLLALAALSLSSCGDPSAPSPNLRIVVATTGVDEDPDGYVVIVDNRLRRDVRTNALVALALEAGTYEVRIQGLAPNCSAQGPTSAGVTIERGLPAEVTFRVQCRAVTGVIQMTASVTGRDFPAVFSVAVTDPSGGSWLAYVPPNGATPVAELAPGQYELRFTGTDGNCALDGEDTRIVPVTAGGLTRDTARVEFAVACQATTGDVRLSVTTTGSAPDPDGYTVELDGVLVEELLYYDYYAGYYEAPVRLPASGSRVIERIAPGDHTFELAEVAPNCAVEAPHPRTVSVSIGAVSEVSLRVVCGAS